MVEPVAAGCYEWLNSEQMCVSYYIVFNSCTTNTQIISSSSFFILLLTPLRMTVSSPLYLSGILGDCLLRSLNMKPERRASNQSMV